MQNAKCKSIKAYNACFVLIVWFAMLVNARAQDPVYTQAFLSPIYLNPGATGAGEHDLRITAIYRRHWWNVPSGMSYMACSIDKYVPGISSAFGFLSTRSTEGYLNKQAFYGSYAYTICPGTVDVAANRSAPGWFWTGALQFGVAQNRIDYNKLVFRDQLTPSGVAYTTTTADVPVNNGKYFPDFAAGTFFNWNTPGNTRWLAGLSAHHINTPDESLIVTADSFRSTLPILWTGNIVYTNTNTENNWSFSAAAIFYKQVKNQSFQVGIEATQNEYDISIGAWYRGGVNFSNMNSLSISVSFNLSGKDNHKDKMRVGIAHDAQVGSSAYSYTAGSTEFGLVWDHSTYDTESDNVCKPQISTRECPGIIR